MGIDTGTEGTGDLQSLGNVGSFTGTICQNEGGMKFIVVSEYEGAIHNEKGIDINELIKHRKNRFDIKLPEELKTNL
jgi:glutamate dehydrogenase (NAD(P)+)